MNIGVDLGGTSTRAVAVADDGTVKGSVVRLPTPACGGADAVLDTIAAAVAAAAEQSACEISGIGVAAAGVIDSTSGTVLSSTSTLAGWAGTDVLGGLAQRFPQLSGAPTPVVVCNDVDAYAQAEIWVGAARNRRSALVVAAGTGVGGALVLEGAVLAGSHNAAGEIGHIPVGGASDRVCPCGRSGHLEGVASGRAVEAAYQRVTGGRALAGMEIAAVADVDLDARRCLSDAGAALGRAIAGLVTTFDPEVVILGGGLAESGDIWADSLRDAMRAELIEPLSAVPVVISPLGAASPLIGATRSLGRTR